MKQHTSVWLSVVGCCAFVSACGIGVQGSVNQTKFLDSGDSTTFTSQGFTIYDKTGILLAAAGTAGDAHVKQKEAEERAIRSGAQAGDSYTYTHNVYAPVPGNWTYLRYDWGKAEYGDRETKYSLFDLRTKLGNWKVLGGKGRVSLPLGVMWLSYKDRDFTWIGMPFGVDVGYTVQKNLTVSGRFVVDPLISGIVLLIGEDWLFVELGGRADYRPVGWLSLYADAMLRRAPNLGSDDPARELQATAGLAFIFGDGKVPDR